MYNCYTTNRLLFFVLGLYLAFSTISSAQNPMGYTDEPVLSGLTAPMGAVFNESGSQMFIWVKSGKIFVANWIGNDYVLQPTPVLDISEEVGDWRDFGFLSIALDPDFDNNGWIYMFYVVDREHVMNFGTPAYDPNDNDYYEATISRLTKYKIDPGSNPLLVDYGTRTVLLGETKETGVPLTHESHAGGTVLFGTDGSLLVTTGDNACYIDVDDGNDSNHTYFQQAINDGMMRPEENVGAFRSQMLTSLCGKLLRLNPDNGDGLPSNPHYEGNNPRSPKSRMYAMGLRNPFRASIEPGSGSTDINDGNPGIIHVADVGWGTWEDLHIFDKPGLNAGWPLFEGLTPHNGYQNTNATNADENNELFEDNCVQPTSFIDDPVVANRRLVHSRPEVAWRHGGTNDARVPWFSGTTPTDPQIGASGSPTTGVMFRGNAGVAGTFIKNASLGSFYEDKIFFTDYVRDWIMVATLTDGTLNWISDVEEFAPVGFGSGIVHMSVSPQDGFLYYTNILGGSIRRITFVPPYWTNAPADLTVEADGTPDPGNAFANWLNSYDGDGACGTLTVSHDSSGLSDDCGSTGTEIVTFTLEDECGNSISQAATFTIEDTTDPVFNEALPTDLDVTCDNIPDPITLTANDTASTATVAFTENTTAGSCAGDYTITRTWTATDECGNETIHIQTLSVTDTTDPGFNEALPADVAVDCSSIPSAATLTASDACSTASVAFTENTTAGSCAGDYTITRTWTATDECGN
ncbi:MAG: PQQ-dependent sugar dehydrogenase, partial [Bacteroidia bacterium]|nr:PQQ-dependent sugar dehydrogenase [Bacteroidia bacterium]